MKTIARIIAAVLLTYVLLQFSACATFNAQQERIARRYHQTQTQKQMPHRYSTGNPKPTKY